MVTGGPLVLELILVATEGPLVSLELVVMATGGVLAPLKVSREADVPVLSVMGLAVVAGGSLKTSDGSGSFTDTLLETSWEFVGSGTGVLTLAPAGVPREDNSAVPKVVWKGRDSL